MRVIGVLGVLGNGRELGSERVDGTNGVPRALKQRSIDQSIILLSFLFSHPE